MPFSTLPKMFLEDLRRHRHGSIVELGSGEGAFTQLLRQEGCDPLTIDRRRFGRAATGGPGDEPAIIADAMQPPLRPASVDLLLAANLLRHLWPLPQDMALPATWLDLLKPEASLYILEDEPLADPPSARLYRDLQDFLARLMPESRRPLLALATFQKGLAAVATSSENIRGAAVAQRDARWNTGHWSFGTVTNRWPVARENVLAWLKRPDAAAGGEAAGLAAAIAREGLSYGAYWWARWTPRSVT